VAGLTIQQILHQGYAAFERGHPLPACVRQAAWALLVCRTAVLGGHIEAFRRGMANASGTIRVATGCVRNVPGCRLNARWRSRGRGCRHGTITT
jgi:hypothetical protein